MNGAGKEQGKLSPPIRLGEPRETLIVPSFKYQIDADIGPDNEILRMIVYIPVRLEAVRRRRFDRLRTLKSWFLRR